MGEVAMQGATTTTTHVLIMRYCFTALPNFMTIYTIVIGMYIQYVEHYLVLSPPLYSQALD